MYDVVILGGGVVGATLALMLAQLNYQVVVIEKNPEGVSLATDKEARTVALSFASIHILETLGVWQLLLAGRVPIEEVMVSVAGRLGRSNLKALEQGVPFLGQVVAFDELEQVLLAKLHQLPNATILNNAKLTHFQAHPERWDLTIEGATISEVKARLLVAADGIDSSIRESLKIPVNKTEYGHFAVLANMERVGAPPFTAIERFLPNGAIALLPWRNNLATCVFTVTQEKSADLMAMTDKAYLATCFDALGTRYGKLVDLGKRVGLPLSMQIAEQQISHRVLLMGNAAHSLHPIAAQGLNLSLRDIWQLKKQLHGARAEDIGSHAFLETYSTARKDDQHRIIFATDKIAKYLSGGPLPMALRALGVTLFDSLLPAKKMFTRYSMGLM